MKVTYESMSLSSGWYDGITPGEDTDGNGKIEDRSGQEVKTVNVNADTANYIYKDGANSKLSGVNPQDVVNYTGTLGKVLANFVTDEDAGKEGSKIKGQNSLNTDGYKDELGKNNTGAKVAGNATASVVSTGATVAASVVGGVAQTAQIASAQASANTAHLVADSFKSMYESGSKLVSQGMVDSSQKAAVQADQAAASAGDGILQLIMAGLMMAMAAGNLAQSFLFDPQLGAREKATEAAEENNAKFDEYSETCQNNVAMMTEAQEEYAEMSGQGMMMQLQQLDAQGEMASEQQVLESQGLTGKEAEGSKGVKGAKGSKEEDPEKEIDGLQESLDEVNEQKEEMVEGFSEYDNYNSEADGAKGVGDSIQEFLQAGGPMKTMAYIMGGLSTACAVICALGVMGWTPKWLLDAPSSIAGKVLVGGAALCYGVAAGKYFAGAKKEGAAADAGETMKEHLSQLQSSVNDSTAEYATTEASVDANDEKVDKTMEKAEEKQDEKLEKEKEQLKKFSKSGTKTEDTNNGDGSTNGTKGNNGNTGSTGGTNGGGSTGGSNGGGTTGGSTGNA